MAGLSAAQHSQIYNELTEATSEATAEVIMQGLVEMPWDNLVTNDRLDARFAEADAKLEESLRSLAFLMLTAMFAVNGALVAVMIALR